MCCKYSVSDLWYDLVFFVKQKTAYEMRISDWSSDVCSSDLHVDIRHGHISLFIGQRTARIVMKPWRSGAFDHPGHAHAANWLCAELVGPGYGLEHDLARPVRLDVGPDGAVGVGHVAGRGIPALRLSRQG